MDNAIAEHANAESSARSALPSLARHAVDARGAYASNTERALRADVAIFSDGCADPGVPPLPASPVVVARFVDAMGALKAPATVRRYVSSVATFYRAAGVPNPSEALEVRLALKRLHPAKGRAQAQATALTRPLIDRMLTAAGAMLKDTRNRALLAVAYDTLCRRSELVALRVGDLEPSAAGDATILVARGKTDQEGEGAVRYLAPDTTDHVRAWIAVGGIKDGRLFRSVGRNGQVGCSLEAGEVARLFKAMALAAGLSVEDVAGISGHSSRVGAAQDMVRHGVDLPAVMQAGGWRSAGMVERVRPAQRRGQAGHASAEIVKPLQLQCCAILNQPKPISTKSQINKIIITGIMNACRTET